MGLRSFFRRQPRLSDIEAIATQVAEAVASQIDSDDALYRPTDAGASIRRDMDRWSHDKAVEAAFTLDQQNPLGHRITEINRDFIVGDGITYSARNPEIEELIGEFWADPVNDLDLRIPDFAKELGLYGELALEAFVGETSGVVQLGYIDPSQIKSVSPIDGNPLVLDRMKIGGKGFGIGGKKLDIVRSRIGESGATALAGDVFYFRVNAPSNATRGWPDLLCIADWLDSYNELLWNMLERAAMMRTFIWDVMLKGMDDAQVTAWMKRNSSPPKAGTVRGHNENVTWSAVAPELGSMETSTEARVILEHISAGAGLPKTWLSSSENVNKASAQVMDVPTVRRLAQRQRYFVRCLRNVVAFVLDQAIAAGRLTIDSEGKVPIYDEAGNQTEETARPMDVVAINAPEISPRDVAAAGGVFTQISAALAVAEDRDWVDGKTVTEVLRVLFAMLGYDFDPSPAEDETQAEDDTDVGTETDEEPDSRKAMEEALRLAG